MFLKLFIASPSFQIYYSIKLQIIQQQKSHVQVQKVQEKVQCWRMFVFIQKNTKSPWNKGHLCWGNVTSLLREAQRHWREASHHCEAHHLRHRRNLVYLCRLMRNDVLAALEMMLTFGQMMLCLRHKWKNPSLLTWIFLRPPEGYKNQGLRCLSVAIWRPHAANSSNFGFAEFGVVRAVK